MNKQEIKFIRGVRGKETEIRQYLQSMGVRGPLFCSFSDETLLFWFGTDKLASTYDINTKIGQLIIENCEELHLPAVFKYKVGDPVGWNDNERFAHAKGVVEEQCDIQGKPLYKVRCDGQIYTCTEEELKPMLFKFKVGDCVKVREIDGGFLSGRVGVISSRIWDGKGHIYYDIKEPSGRTRVDEDSIDLYDMSKVKSWDDLEGTPLKGWFVTTDGDIEEVDGDKCLFTQCDKNVAVTEKTAKAMLAMAQISQLMPYYGGAITDEEWKDDDVDKYVIARINNSVTIERVSWVYHFLAFHAKEKAQEFLTNNPQLVNDFLMVSDDEDISDNQS